MKQSGKVAFSGVVCALALFVLLPTRMIPVATYALPAAAGVLLGAVVVEAGVKWGWLSFAAVALLAPVVAEPEAAVMFIAFLGYYPVLKSLVERLRSRAAEWAIKLAVFNLTMIAAYWFVLAVLGIPEDTGLFGKYTALVLLALGNVVFVVYDIGTSRVLTFYLYRLHPRISRMIRQNRPDV